MALPIHAILDEVIGQFPAARLVIQAPPGAGKSTELPLALVNQLEADSGLIVVLQPRRVAAVSIAHYLASRLGEEVGEQVGYQVRGEQKRSANTRLLIITEGILVRWLQTDPELNGVNTVIFDEFHERNLFSDLSLALLLETLALRPSLSLLIMSATLPAEPIRDWLEQATASPVSLLKSDGQRFPVERHYRPVSGGSWLQALPEVIVEAFHACDKGVLVFVPGVGEIQWLLEQLATRLTQVPLLPLHGRLSLSEQRQALKGSEQRRIIVSTNIAETSLTIDGIDVVVDSGRERVSRYRPQYDANQLSTRYISMASANQRAGRAGRLQPGQVFRLWSSADEHGFNAFSEPDIETQELSQLVAEVSLWGTRPEQLHWLTPPAPVNIDAAYQTLAKLQLMDSQQRLTELGNAVLSTGGDSRLARIAHAVKDQPDDCKAAVAQSLATLEEPQRQWLSDDFVLSVQQHASSYQQRQKGTQRWAQRYRFWLQQLSAKHTDNVDFSTLGHWLLFGFTHRLAKRQQQDAQLVSGAKVYELPSFVCNGKSEWLLLPDIRLAEQASRNRASSVLQLEESSLLSHPAVQIDVVTHVDFQASKRPVAYQEQRIGKLFVRRQTAEQQPTTEQIQQGLMYWLRHQGLSALAWDERSERLWHRLYFLWHHQPDAFTTVAPNETDLLDKLALWALPYWTDVNSVAQLQRWQPTTALQQLLDYETQRQFDVLCPEYWQAPSGRQVRIHYPSPRELQQGTPAVAALKLQEAFGEPQSPTLLNGQQPLVLDLLSPAGRQLQRTEDLASFWQQGYPQVRKEMRGRYPKHPWPDDPVSAVATHKTKRQML